MATKLSRLCDGLIEAAWLAVIIITPLFFNVNSSRIFEPDKITLLRSLVLLILIAWLVKLVDQAGSGLKNVGQRKSRFITLIKTPLVLPVLFILLVYLISTIFSVTPRASIWGSYQRLQGSYTTFSYLIIFAALGFNLRRRVQVERLITTAILTSLPVSLYGVLQRYHLDPIPWGGDVSLRIASSMGNSIFVAAYLIMVFPLTLGRIFESFRAILNEIGHQTANILRAAIYVFIAALQVIALYMSQSRGPVLGWFAGLFFILLMLTLWWRKRWATYTIIGGAVIVAVLLFAFNLANGPLAKLRASPAIGRFGLLLNAESNSALVRQYIWEGDVKLVSPHAPLVFPNGQTDRFNLLRPLVGYGPESMFVAYNPFYVPSLGIVELRNATPDRSHNETWDSLVITGIMGLVVYLWIFTSVFYYGLKWMGLIDTRYKGWLFFGLYLGGGVAGGLFFSIWRGIEYLGVGIPFGIFLGLIIYVIIAAFMSARADKRKLPVKHSEIENVQFMTLLVLVAAVLSHFVEINFGIAIGATRTYFWIYTALLLVVGYLLPKIGEYSNSPLLGQPIEDFIIAVQPNIENTSQGIGNSSGNPGVVKQRSRSEKGVSKRRPSRIKIFEAEWIRESLVSVGLLSITLVTLGYDLILNTQKDSSAISVLWQSFTRLAGGKLSFGILGLLLTTWALAAVLYALEGSLTELKTGKLHLRLLKSLFIILVLSIVFGLAYWIWHSGNLARLGHEQPANIADLLGQVGRYAGLLTNYYLVLFGLVLFLAIFIPVRLPIPARLANMSGAIAVPIGIVLLAFLVVVTNLRVIQADITFKIAQGLNQPGMLPVAIRVYERANQLAPNEDYYYLFLGRAYLEEARQITSTNERDKLFMQAAQDLKKAQSLNPLNTDHTANLARLYSYIAATAQDQQNKNDYMAISDQYFSRAVSLSPNNVRLWNEWAYLTLQVMQQPDKARSLLERALQVDPSFGWTYGQIGDIYVRQGEAVSVPTQRQVFFENAVDQYEQSLAKLDDTTLKYNYSVALGGVLGQLNRLDEAIAAYRRALVVYPQSPNAWRVEETISQIYKKLGDQSEALQAAETALASAPQDQKTRLQAFIDQLQIPP